MGGLCSGPKDPEALTLDEVIHNTCASKTCDGWIERKTAEETEWQYVGQGKGGFEQVSAWDYVGEGNGSYSKDTKTTYHGWRCGSYGAVCTAFLGLVGFVVLLTRLVLPSANGAEAPAAGAPEAREAHSRVRAPPAMAEPYNCSSHYFNQPWTQSKALWCCAERGVGCTTAPPTAAPGTSWMLLPVPMAPAGAAGALAATPGGAAAAAPAGAAEWRPTRSSFSSRVVLPPVEFDCSSDSGHWRTSWSSRKKEWCCKHERRGCRFDCRDGADRAESWPPDKRAWCCQRGPEWCGAAASTGPATGAG